MERAVEGLEILAPGDERLSQRPVHVLLAGEVDRVEAPQRIGDAPRADLEPAFPQHAPEEDDVADDRVFRHRRRLRRGRRLSHGPPRRVPRGPRRGSRAGPRGT